MFVQKDIGSRCKTTSVSSAKDVFVDRALKYTPYFNPFFLYVTCFTAVCL